MGTTNKRDKDIKHCVWCGAPTLMEEMQLPDTPIIEHMEEKINNHDRKRIWGDLSDWSKLDLDSDFEAELLVYDEMLGTMSLKTVCETCLGEDDRLWQKYYTNDEIRFDEDF